MIAAIALFVVTLFLAYANGANDNFKGVATLFGSRTTNYKIALGWATVTTLAGSLFSVVLAHELIAAFSGKGLVPIETAQEPLFLLAVAFGAGLTVMIAALLGFPISTTHALVGALIGAGLSSTAGQVHFSALGKGFVLPLLVSPLIAVVLAAALYYGFRYMRERIGITKEFCLCVGESRRVTQIASSMSQLAIATDLSLQADVAEEQVCIERYKGALLGVKVEKILDVFHFISGGMVSFARGLNDTPKIMGLLLVAGLLNIQISMVMIAVAMAIGGLLNARKVAYVMSRDITYLNHGQGFTANIVTATLVIFASKLGMPVSTTHVSVGTLFGIGSVNGKADYKVIRKILASWVLTLPIAAASAALVMFALRLL